MQYTRTWMRSFEALQVRILFKTPFYVSQALALHITRLHYDLLCVP